MIALLGVLALASPGPEVRMGDLHVTVDTRWDGSPADPAETFHVTLRDGGPNLLLLVDAPYHGDPAPDAPAGSLWGLWQDEVVELFVLGLGGRYLEVEVGPHGHHIVLQLDGPRNAVATGLPLSVQARIDGDRWTATASIPRSYLPSAPHRINVTAVHGEGEQRRFLSWVALPGARPDFHQPDVFRPVTLP